MKNGNRLQPTEKLRVRIAELTSDLVSASDYGVALNTAVELMDSIHELLAKLRESNDSRVQ